ncbi:reverse transcriptase domain-containing protein [Tanacetum coccineum]
MAKPISNNAQGQNLAEPRNESNVKIEFSKELLTELQNNTFSGRYEEDVIGQIGKVLEILDLVKIAVVDPFQLRMKAFPLSLSKEAKKWWMNEEDMKISTWEELVKKFLKKFYPLSCARNYDKRCDDDEEGRELLVFIP